MTGLRTTLSKKVNVGKSNKMIYAVAGGIAILLLIFIISSLGDPEPQSKEELFKDKLGGLKTQKGAVFVNIDQEKNSLRIVYDSKVGERYTRKVFRSVKEVSQALPEIEITVVLAEETQNNVVRTYTMKNGRIIRDQ